MNLDPRRLRQREDAQARRDRLRERASIHFFTPLVLGAARTYSHFATLEDFEFVEGSVVWDRAG